MTHELKNRPFNIKDRRQSLNDKEIGNDLAHELKKVEKKIELKLYKMI
jgi:hypothetical protein